MEHGDGTFLISRRHYPSNNGQFLGAENACWAEPSQFLFVLQYPPGPFFQASGLFLISLDHRRNDRFPSGPALRKPI